MAKRDYYEVLGLSRGASEAEIKKAYRRLARKLHPDVNPGDKAAQKRFQEVQEAYDVLKDEEKRRAYDRFGHAGPGGGFDPRTAGGAGFPPGGFPGGAGRGSPFEGIHFESGDFGDLFGNIFGGRRSTGPEPGEDMRGQIEVPFRDAVLGGTALDRVPDIQAGLAIRWIGLCLAQHDRTGSKPPVSISTTRRPSNEAGA